MFFEELLMKKIEQSRKVMIVTGANRGLGFEVSKELAKTSVSLVMACRNLVEGEKAKNKIKKTSDNNQIRVMQLDLGSFSSIREFSKKFNQSSQRLDVLVNNAGIFTMDKGVTEDGLEMTMGVNYFGTFLLTNLLLPLMEKSNEGRIINVISDAYKRGKFDFDNIKKSKVSGFRAYASSKFALAVFTLTLARKLKSKCISVNAVHPGHVDSGMWEFNKWYAPIIRFFGKRSMIDVEKGAEPILFLALSEKVRSVTGKYFKRDEEEELVFVAVEDQKKLWEKSLKIVGLV
jgi:NAD(P)-dependent dehydrogenase (short-subunit alcohol dehydrogenase family)